MPEPRCLKCSVGIGLDTTTYWNYNGQLRCPTCGFQHVITLSEGGVLRMKALVEEKYLLHEDHEIPKQPLGDYQEAVNNLSVGSWKSCAVMARRALQGALLAKGVADGRIGAMIADAKNKHGLLTQKQFAVAQTVVFLGGKGGHPEESPQEAEINLVGEIEASNGLWVIKTLLLELFPSRSRERVAERIRAAGGGSPRRA